MSPLRLAAAAVLAAATLAAPTARQPEVRPAIDLSVLQGWQWRHLGTPDQRTDDVRAVAVDAATPSRVCTVTADGVVHCLPSRGRGIESHVLDAPPGSAVAPDPADPAVMYVAAVLRHDRRTGQTQDVAPRIGPPVRSAAVRPLLFAPQDQRTLYFADDQLWRTETSGRQWTAVSPGWGTAVTAVMPSPVDRSTILIGTADGRILQTRDAGATWRDVSPADPGPSATTALAGSHFDVHTAYAAVQVPGGGALLRTRDGGDSWTTLRTQSSGPLHVIREDALRRGLLFAGGSDGLLVSFDDGDSWQSLSRNLPAVPIRSLAIKDADLFVGTEGAGVWILDDITPLRQLTHSVATAAQFLFRPPVAWRVRDSDGSMFGVSVSYLLGPDSSAATIDILDADGIALRRFAGAATPGIHRLQWDLRSTPAADDVPGVFVVPGTYTIRLTVSGQVSRQSLTVRLDPRVTATTPDLAEQHRVSTAVHELIGTLDARRLGAAGADLDVLDRMRAPLPDLLRALQQADARPTAAQVAALEAARARLTGR